MEMPDPTQQDVEWAYLLWNSLALDGVWNLPEVGVYRKTGERQITLVEIHSTVPSEAEGLFSRHHWIMQLGDLLGWTVEEAVERAYQNDVVVNVPEDMIGEVAACASRCGCVVKVEPVVPGVSYYEVDDECTCPCCGTPLSFDRAFRGVHVIVDDSGRVLKQERMQAFAVEE